MNKCKLIFWGVLFLILTPTFLGAQNVMKKETNQKYKAYIDSLKKAPYEWRLPIMGQKLRSLGFDIPYPNGIMVNLIFAKQQVTLSDLAIGLEEDPDTYMDVSNIVRFESIEPVVSGINVRYDFWALPFLNIYALGGYVNSQSHIQMALPFEASFKSHSKGPMVGWGAAIAGGLGPLFIQGDYNMAWTFLPQLSNAALAQVGGIRLGRTFKFPQRPASNISVLLGAQVQKINAYSEGSVNLSNLTDISSEDKQNAQGQLDDWYDELPQNQQEAFAGMYDKLGNWLSDEEDTYLYYSFNKKLYYPWSMTLGVNYQINHRYIVMAMYTFLGSREQLLVSFNYRFGIKGKNYLKGVTL